jgi:hypothetical protein
MHDECVKKEMLSLSDIMCCCDDDDKKNVREEKN